VEPLQLDRIRPAIAFQLLDFAVNSGPRAAKRELQRALGVVVDGVIGPKTLEALHERDEADVVMLLLAERIDLLTGLQTWLTHGRGWMRRIAANLRYGAEDT